MASTTSHFDRDAAVRMYDTRIREIHRPRAPGKQGDEMTPLHRQELQAMFDSFLGEGFDAAKVGEVAALQTALRAMQLSLSRRLNSGQLTPKQYADDLNLVIKQTMNACESVLGANDFQRLFGAPNSGD